jgi:hypothetical protein
MSGRFDTREAHWLVPLKVVTPPVQDWVAVLFRKIKVPENSGLESAALRSYDEEMP